MNFLNQGVPLFRLWRIQVILHWTFLIYAGYEIYDSNGHYLDVALSIVVVFGIVLLHEFGHCIACRAVKGDADHIVLWPLGGLAMCQPPATAFAWLVTTVGGPLINVLLIPIFYGLHSHGMINFYDGHFSGTMADYTVGIIDYAMKVNLWIFYFNVLVPMYPMDCGRLIQEILWFGFGYRTSLQIAGMIGTVCGVALVVVGLGFWSVRIPIPGQTPLVLGGDHEVDGVVAIIGLLGCVESFRIYLQSQEIAGWRKR